MSHGHEPKTEATTVLGSPEPTPTTTPTTMDTTTSRAGAASGATRKPFRTPLGSNAVTDIAGTPNDRHQPQEPAGEAHW